MCSSSISNPTSNAPDHQGARYSETYEFEGVKRGEGAGSEGRDFVSTFKLLLRRSHPDGPFLSSEAIQNECQENAEAIVVR